MAGRLVSIVDDHKSVREALGEMLSVFGFQVALHGSARDFLSSLDGVLPGCVVADVRMPGMDGIELVEALKKRGSSDIPIILISGHADVPMAVAGIKAGARDFFEKPIDDVQLVAAINRAWASADAMDAGLPERELQDRFARLTPRQIEIFDYVAQGYSSAAIASLLGISRRTVESYRADIMEKMQAESVAVLVRQAIRLRRLVP
jgi:two-component system response regulator FixJ